MTATTALLTDMYELTMLEATISTGMADRRSVFEVFNRRLPARRRYGVVAGTARILDAVENFRFTPAEIDFLAAEKVVSDATVEFLASYRFGGHIMGYAEGECFFPGSPIVTVEGTFGEAVLLETVILSILNYDCAVAAAGSRMTSAAHGRPCLDMGARRTHELSAVSAARASVVAGFVGTSNLEAARQYGITPIGTAAHSFTLLHDDEEAAFDAQIEALGTDTTLLVDTYDIEQGVERAVAAARRAGGELGAVRIDSGDLVSQAFLVRKQLDDLGAPSTRITVTSDLDEYAIAALGAAPVDAYGVGTRLVTGSGHPTAELVYKLVAREGADGTMVGVQKESESKATVGGKKYAGRVLDSDGFAREEVTVSAEDPEAAVDYLGSIGARALQVDLVRDGVINESQRGPNALAEATERHVASRAELPYPAWRLSEGEPAIPTRNVDL